MKSHTLKNGRRLLGIPAITTHTVSYNHITRNKLELCKIYIYIYICIYQNMNMLLIYQSFKSQTK